MELDTESIEKRMVQGLPGATAVCKNNPYISGDMQRYSCKVDLLPYADAEFHIISEPDIDRTMIYLDDIDTYRDAVGNTLQKQGIGKKIFSNLVAVAQELDVDKLSVQAARMGSYMWLRAGFLPDKLLTQHVMSEVYGRLSRLKAPAEAINVLKADLESLDPKSLWRIADSVYGRELLQNIEYTASIDLRGDPAATKRLLEYTTLTKEQDRAVIEVLQHANEVVLR
ncbi:hypothetical protein [Methylocystis sp.]|uniref:hypothetical protein n=1 Tax=Methylocystis sp. TaxID=1911079 RepID=UPI003DA54420